MAHSTNTGKPNTDERTGTLVRDFLLLWPYARPYRKYLIVSILAMMVAAGAVLSIGRGLKKLVDGVLFSGDPQSLNTAMVVALVIIVLLALSSAVRFYSSTVFCERMALALRRALYGHMLGLSPSFFSKQGVSDLLVRFTNEVEAICGCLGGQLSSALRNVVLVGGGLIMMVLSSPVLTGFVALFVPLFFVPIMIFGRRVRRIAEAVQRLKAAVFGQASESLYGLPVVQAYNHEQADLDRHDALSAAFFAKAREGYINRACLTFGVILVVFSCVAVIVWLGGHEVFAGNISVGELAEFIFYAAMVTAALNSLVDIYSSFIQVGGSIKRVFQAMHAKSMVTVSPTPTPLPSPAQGALEMRDVRFAYADEATIFEGFNLHIKPGEKVALVGPSGAGKSTLFRLLLRFYDPDSGDIYVDGVNIRHCCLDHLRRRFGLVTQDPVIFDTDIAENIRYGNPDASMKDIEAAAQEAAAHAFIKYMPRGYRTLVGERGEQLSGGQKQRLAIARAFLRRPTILLLDEATSSLDVENESLIQKALERLMVGRTTLIIAHRLSTVRRCDRIVVMSHGRILDQGDHDTLVAKGGLYAHYTALQYIDETPPVGEAPRLANAG